MARIPPFRPLPLLLAGLLALAPLHRAQAETGPARQTIGGEPVVQIATGAEHACALVQSVQVWCWGRGFFGTLGNDSTGNSSTPVLVQGLTGVTLIAAGGYHNCALRCTGRVFCWGSNGNGQIGDGTTTDRLTRAPAWGARAGRLAARRPGADAAHG
jgi:alpha-tubulin suppressor-like RCC1 family protein